MAQTLEDFMLTTEKPAARESKPATRGMSWDEFMGPDGEPRQPKNPVNDMPGPMQSFLSGLDGSINLGLARTPAFVYGAAAYPQNLVARLTGWNIGAPTPDWLVDNPITRHFERASAARSYNANTYPQEDMFSLVKKGRVGDAADWFVNAVAENTPYAMTFIGAALTGVPVSSVAVAGGVNQGALSFGEARKKGLDDLDSVSVGVLNGTLETVFEQAGTGKLFEWGTELFSHTGKQAGSAIVKNVFKYTLGSMFGEGAEEAATQMTQDFVNKIYGVEDIPWKDFPRRAAIAMATAMAQGGMTTAPGGIINGVRVSEEQAAEARAEAVIAKLSPEKGTQDGETAPQQEPIRPNNLENTVKSGPDVVQPAQNAPGEAIDTADAQEAGGPTDTSFDPVLLEKAGINEGLTESQAQELGNQVQEFERRVLSSGTEGVKIPESMILAEARRLRADMIESQPVSQLEQFVTDNGGVRPFKEGVQAEEFKTIPKRFQNNQGRALDEMAQNAVDAGLLPAGSGAEELRQALIDIGDKPKAPKLGQFRAEAEDIARWKREGFARVQSDLKSKIREVTGQTSGEKTVTEEQALNASLKRQQTAARVAAIQTRLRVNEAHRLVRKIRSADINEITAESRVQIEQLQELLKTTPAKERSLEWLRNLNDRIQAVKEIGKQDLSANRQLRRDTFLATKEVLLSTLRGGGEPAVAPAVTKETPMNMAKGLRLATLRPSRWLDMMDGKQDFQGPFHQTFYDQPNRAYTDEVDNAKEGSTRGIEILKEHGIRSTELSDVIKADGVEVTNDEAMHIYLAFGNLENRAAIAFGNHIGVNTQQKIIEQLPEKFKRAADDYAKEFNDHYDRIRLALLEFTDGKEDMGRVQGTYVPMQRVDRNYISSDEEILDDLAARRGLKKAYANRGFTKGRIQISPEFQRPIKLGLTGIYFGHVAKREHFIAMGNVVKNLQGLVHDREISQEIRLTHGGEMVDELERYINRLANPNIYRSFTAVEKSLRVFREKAVVVNLGFNLMSMMRQLPGGVLALGEVGPIELAEGTYQAYANYDKTKQFVNERDPQMADRNIERELEEIKKARPAGPDSVLHRLSDESLRGIGFFDGVVVRSVWMAKYNQMIRAGASEEEAIEGAQKTVLRTQNASAPKDIASIYSANEFLNLFLAFSNQLNQIYNQVTYDIPSRASIGRGKASMLGGVGIALNALAMFTMSFGRLPDDGDDVGEMLKDAALSIIPVIGPMINSWRNGFDGLPAPLEILKKAYKATDDTKKLISGDGGAETVGKILDNGLYVAAFAAGMPYSQIRRTIKGIVDLGQGDTNDLRRLIYSEYALKDNSSRNKPF